jgi:DNA-binding LacI/PurR family transcriptional regulator
VARVQASIRELGYTPNAAGRALSLGRTNIIGLVTAVLPELPEAEADIFMRFVRAAIFSAKRHGYNILLMDGGVQDLQATPLVDGLLVMDIRYHEDRLSLIRSRGVPAVLVGMPEQTAGLSAVDLDFAEAGQLAVRHLAELGHRDIAILGSTTAGTDELSWSVRFHRGAAEAARRAGARLSPSACGPTAAELDRWLDEATAQDGVPTAIILLNVALIEPLLRRAAERRV